MRLSVIGQYDRWPAMSRGIFRGLRGMNYCDIRKMKSSVLVARSAEAGMAFRRSRKLLGIKHF